MCWIVCWGTCFSTCCICCMVTWDTCFCPPPWTICTVLRPVPPTALPPSCRPTVPFTPIKERCLARSCCGRGMLRTACNELENKWNITNSVYHIHTHIKSLLGWTNFDIKIKTNNYLLGGGSFCYCGCSCDSGLGKSHIYGRHRKGDGSRSVYQCAGSTDSFHQGGDGCASSTDATLNLKTSQKLCRGYLHLKGKTSWSDHCS